MRILITGSRTWTDTHTITEAIWKAIHDHNNGTLITIVHGACPDGADTIADRLAREWGWHPEPHPADWNRYGNRAGPIRNKEMVDLGADVCLAFIHNNSKGASGCADLAYKAGIPTLRYENID